MEKVNQVEAMSFKGLNKALTAMLGKGVTANNYEKKNLQGGTVGDVWLVTGIANTSKEKGVPYKIVLKTQEKWERFGDPGSWRREYDLYLSDLGEYFSKELRWPKCYHAEMNEGENETQLWMEVVEGTTGQELSEEMYEKAAYELGRFQGKLYAEKPSFLNEITNLSNDRFLENFYKRYRSWHVVYDYIRSENCEIPKHLCNMLMDIDDQAEEIFKGIEKLPRILCHRDFWVANIFSSNKEIRLIDWDTTGWGYLGEDLASLIADESKLDAMVSLYQKSLPAYVKGFSEYRDISHIKNLYVWERMLLMFGYRIGEWYLDGESEAEKEYQIATLQKIYEMEKA